MKAFWEGKKFFFLPGILAVALVIVIGVLNPTPGKNFGEGNPDNENKVCYQISYSKTFGVEEAKSKEEEPYEFASICDVACDADGNIYTLDGKLDCVKKFTRDGEFVKTFFGRGKGPDEIANAYRLLIDEGRLLVFHEYGYEIKAFDLEGKFLQSYRLPEQCLRDVDTWESRSGKRLVYSALARNSDGDLSYNNFKTLDLDALKIENTFAPTRTPSTLNTLQTLAIEKKSGTLWTANTELIKLEAYDLGNRGELLKTITIPGKFKRNTVIYFSKDERNIIQPVYYNLVQPFILHGQLFFTLTENQLEADSPEEAIYPAATRLTLYHVDVDNEKPEKIQVLDDCGLMSVGTTIENRVILYGYHPYPRFKIVEINPGEMIPNPGNTIAAELGHVAAALSARR